MKYKLNKPFLSSIELARVNYYAAYFGYLLKFNLDRGTALIETEEKDIAYVQKDEFNHIFLVWKKGERIEHIDSLIKIAITLEKNNVFTDAYSRIRTFFGINNITGTEVTSEMKQYINTTKYYEHG